MNKFQSTLDHFSNDASPLAQNGRLLHLDALRGLALLGILMVNIWFFADSTYATSSSLSVYDNTTDKNLFFFIHTLFESKFYLLFSFMFGYSFVLQENSIRKKGEVFTPRMIRRFICLFIIGVIHGYVFYNGDIMSIYACLGVVLLLFSRLKFKTMLVLVSFLIVSTSILWITLAIKQYSVIGNQVVVQDIVSQTKLAAFSGDALTTFFYFKQNYISTLGALWLLQGTSTLSLFLVGYIAAKKEILIKINPFVYLKQKKFWLIFCIGLIGSTLYGYAASYHAGSALEIFSFGLVILTAPLLMVCYIIFFLSAFIRKIDNKIFTTYLPALGKMSMTNYVSQSIFLNLIFTGYGLGLVDKLPAIGVIVLGLLVFVVQIILSMYWLKNHQYGSLEWILRAFTQLKFPKWKKELL